MAAFPFLFSFCNFCVSRWKVSRWPPFSPSPLLQQLSRSYIKRSQNKKEEGRSLAFPPTSAFIASASYCRRANAHSHAHGHPPKQSNWQRWTTPKEMDMARVVLLLSGRPAPSAIVRKIIITKSFGLNHPRKSNWGRWKSLSTAAAVCSIIVTSCIGKEHSPLFHVCFFGFLGKPRWRCCHLDLNWQLTHTPGWTTVF